MIRDGDPKPEGLLKLPDLRPETNVRSPDGKFWGTVESLEQDGLTISWCTMDGKNLPEDRALKYAFDSGLELVEVPWREPMPRDYRLPKASPEELPTQSPMGLIARIRRRFGG